MKEKLKKASISVHLIPTHTENSHPWKKYCTALEIMLCLKNIGECSTAALLSPEKFRLSFRSGDGKRQKDRRCGRCLHLSINSLPLGPSSSSAGFVENPWHPGGIEMQPCKLPHPGKPKIRCLIAVWSALHCTRCGEGVCAERGSSLLWIISIATKRVPSC